MKCSALDSGTGALPQNRAIHSHSNTPTIPLRKTTTIYSHRVNMDGLFTLHSYGTARKRNIHGTRVSETHVSYAIRILDFIYSIFLCLHPLAGVVYGVVSALTVDGWSLAAVITG